MTKLLVHICCAPCAAYCLEKLTDDGYDVTGYFYNPNIHPEAEYEKRKQELAKLPYKVIIEEDPPGLWFKAVEGLENEPEGGKRCEVCFRQRLDMTAFYAKENRFDAFTTVLTVSPHKNNIIINKIGNNISRKYNIPYIEENFKRNNGSQKSIELAKKYGFYRQNYCGCVYSYRKGESNEKV